MRTGVELLQGWARMTPQIGRGTTRLTNLSSTLWRLREVLDHLLFKIFETQLILESDATHWLAKAGRELDAALQELRHVEVMRAVETVAAADQLHSSADITLAELTRRAPAPWTSIFEEHRTALRELTGTVDHALDSAPRVSETTADVDVDIELVRRFATETLGTARQASLITF